VVVVVYDAGAVFHSHAMIAFLVDERCSWKGRIGADWGHLTTLRKQRRVPCFRSLIRTILKGNGEILLDFQVGCSALEQPPTIRCPVGDQGRSICRSAQRSTAAAMRTARRYWRRVTGRLGVWSRFRPDKVKTAPDTRPADPDTRPADLPWSLTSRLSSGQGQKIAVTSGRMIRDRIEV